MAIAYITYSHTQTLHFLLMKPRYSCLLKEKAGLSAFNLRSAGEVGLLCWHRSEWPHVDVSLLLLWSGLSPRINELGVRWQRRGYGLLPLTLVKSPHWLVICCCLVMGSSLVTNRRRQQQPLSSRAHHYSLHRHIECFLGLRTVFLQSSHDIIMWISTGDFLPLKLVYQ